MGKKTVSYKYAERTKRHNLWQYNFFFLKAYAYVYVSEFLRSNVSLDLTDFHNDHWSILLRKSSIELICRIYESKYI